MTVSSSITTHSYIPAGSMLAESLAGLVFIDAANLVVTDPNDAVQVLGTDYEITGNGRTGTASIRTLRVYAGGLVLTVTRTTPSVQEANIEPQQPLPAEAVEKELDRRALIEQETRRSLAEFDTLALQVPKGQVAPVVDMTGLAEGELLQYRSGKLQRFLHAPFAGKYFAGDPTGLIIPATGLGGGDEDLRADLASGDAGAAMVAVKQTGTGAIVENLLTWARRVGVYPEQFKLPGDPDDTLSFTRMFALAGLKKFICVGAYVVTTTFAPPAGATIDGYGIGKITVTTANTSLFNVQNNSKVDIQNLEMEATAFGANAYVAAVVLDNSTNCKVKNCTAKGFQWGGVYLANANSNTIDEVYVVDMLGTVSDAADIHVYYNSSYNLIINNRCFGGRTVGVNVQDPGGNGDWLPQGNIVRNNTIGAHTVFGINVYIGSPPGTIRDSSNLVDGNLVYDITGTGNVANGMGIYCVGNGLGGLRVVNNGVSNCCINTENRTNGPGGITISGFGQTEGLTGNAIPPYVGGNTINKMTQGDGLLIVSCLNGCTLGPNNATLTAANNGSGPGGGTLIGQALRIDNSNDVNGVGGIYTNRGVSDAVFVFVSSGDRRNINLSGMKVKTATGYGLRTSRLSTFRLARSNFHMFNGESGGGAFSVDALDDSSLMAIKISSGATYAGEIYRCKTTNFNGLRLAGTNALLTSGDCTGSVFDKSNIMTGAVENAATGLLIERYGTAAPTTGAGALGDRVLNRTPGSGLPVEWLVTAAAYPGTWSPGYVMP